MLRPYMVLAGFLLVILGLLLLGFSFLCPYQQNENASKPSEQYYAAQPKMAVSTNNQADSEPSDQESPKQSEQIKRGGFYSWVVSNEKFFSALSTAVIAAFTLALAFATLMLWCATRDLVQNARETSERQLRAYVFIKDVSLILIENDTALDVTVVFHNSGQTPGYDLRTSLQVDVKPPPESGSPYGELVPPEAKSIIAPDALASVGPYRINLRPGTLDDLLAGRQKIYLWGRLDYVDAFRKDRYFTFQGTNGSFFENRDLATGRVNFRGWHMQPSPDGYKAN